MTKYILCCLFLMGASSLTFAQNGLRITGNLQISHEYYNANAENFDFNARKPDNLTRLVFNPSLEWGNFRLPFSIMLSSQGTNTITPPGQFTEAYAIFNEIKTFEDLKAFVQNPINRVSVSPKLGSLQFQLGTHTPRYSELTQGNISLFGGGFTWQPGKFFVGANYGVAQSAIERDTALNIVGAYERVQYGGRIGFGNLSKSYFALNVTGGRDVLTSVEAAPAAVLPEDGLTSSLEFRLQLGKSLTWGGEAAAGLFTANLNQISADLSEFGIAIPDFITYNLSTRLDGAASSYIELKRKLWGVKAKGLYVGQGYRTFGYPFFQSDRLEWTVSPRMSLFKRKVNISGSIGSRTNNVSGTKAAPMTQLLASANVNAQIGQKLNVNASYSNFGIRNTIDNDTLKIENVSENISITPTLVLNNESAVDVFTIIFSRDAFEDFNVVSGALNNNQALVAGLNYNRTFKNNPLTIGANLMRFQLNSTQIAIDNNTLGATVGYKFFDKKLRTSLGVSYLMNRQAEDVTHDRQVLFNAQVKYQSKKKYSLSIQATNNAYAYGSARPGARLTETNFRVVAGKRF